MMGRRCSSTVPVVFALALLCVVASVAAHVQLVTPRPREDGHLQPADTVCGGAQLQEDRITELIIDKNMTLSWVEHQAHTPARSDYVIAYMRDDEEEPDASQLLAVVPAVDETLPYLYSVQVKAPNTTCTLCVLRLQMRDDGVPEHNVCADVRFVTQFSVEDRTRPPTSTPSEMPLEAWIGIALAGAAFVSVLGYAATRPRRAPPDDKDQLASLPKDPKLADPAVAQETGAIIAVSDVKQERKHSRASSQGGKTKPDVTGPGPSKRRGSTASRGSGSGAGKSSGSRGSGAGKAGKSSRSKSRAASTGSRASGGKGAGKNKHARTPSRGSGGRRSSSSAGRSSGSHNSGAGSGGARARKGKSRASRA